MTIPLRALILIAPLLTLTAGCSIATLPVRATSQMVDWSTTSRAEADRNRGRVLRKQDEQDRRSYRACIRQGYSNC